ncbi:septum formation family protein [Amycolatopsis sp. CA-126428]|uniref:septum formation family protein n=1 Tax=Amycolatopsis sp. CA-126428 TaxID=2073158 RepID=UPI001E3CBF7E|nr:septum formation family protein [Amycolatopsis sp. CA-126428]
MSAPQHDPELFDELMRTELRRQPISGYAIATLVFGLLGGLLAPVFGAIAISRIRKQRQRGLVLVVCGLIAFTAWMGVLAYLISTGTAWWQQRAAQDRLPENVVHGLDLGARDCFWSPAASGEADVFLTSCAAPHTGEAFDVLPLGEGPMPDILELYRDALARCEAGARPVPDVRVQVVTPTSSSWAAGKHRAVCYYHFAAETTGPVR